jgi:pimeloyl-ACP methyl ester carboxylesterase
VIRFGYADTSYGQMHYAECGSGDPVLLLHQTPRSVDEYREVLPLLGAGFWAIAVDTIGFGASARAGEHSIEAYAGAVLAFLDARALAAVHLAGHHTGGVIAIEVAARAPGRVRRLVLSATPYVDGPARAARAGRPPVDRVEPRPDGTHLAELWQRRQGFYPPGRPDLLHRFVRDALTAWPDVEQGHAAVGAYRMEDRIGLIRCPTLCVGAAADPHSFGSLGSLAARIPGAATAVIDGGMVPLEWQAAEFARLAGEFFATGKDDDDRHGR